MKYLDYFVDIQIFNTIFKSRDNNEDTVPANKIKKLFDMVKVIKQNPVSKRDGVKKYICTHYQCVTTISLTAMPGRGLTLVNKSPTDLKPGIKINNQGCTNAI